MQIPAAFARDSAVALTLDGRPISHKAQVALVHDGVLFVDAVDLTRVFDGLLIFEKAGARITVRGNTFAFHLGQRTAIVDHQSVRIAGAPFEYAGDVFVPMSAILSADKGLSLTWTGRNRADLHVTVFPKGS